MILPHKEKTSGSWKDFVGVHTSAYGLAHLIQNLNIIFAVFTVLTSNEGLQAVIRPAGVCVCVSTAKT